MKRLLRIDCSARTKGSHSRSIADYFEKNWKLINPDGTVIYRDLAKFQIPHIQNETIEGFYASPEYMSDEKRNATALSDDLITELKSSDEILISSPMYNLNIPSNLKAYLDQVVRIRHTFDIGKDGYQGLLKNKRGFLITVKGGSYKGTPMEPYDFQEPYLQAILGHMGIKTERVFSLEGTSDSNEQLEQNMHIIKNGIEQIFQRAEL